MDQAVAPLGLVVTMACTTETEVDPWPGEQLPRVVATPVLRLARDTALTARRPALPAPTQAARASPRTRISPIR